jgi:mono/diheme cytochrome c family protein
MQMRTPLFAASLCVLTLATGLAVLVSGCRSLPPSKDASLFTPEEARGAQVYKVKCARCHRPNDTRPLNGPGLQALTKVKAMPSGAPPTDERLAQVIISGRSMMPGTQLTDSQMSDLLAYLHTL